MTSVTYAKLNQTTRKLHPNPKPLEKLRIVDGGLFFPHGPNQTY